MAMLANVISRGAALVLSRVLSIASVAVLARYLGKEGFGEYAFVVSYLAFFRLIGNLGLDPILIKRLSTTSSQDSPRIVGNAFIVKLLLSGLAIGSADAMARAVPISGLLRTAIFVSAFSLLAVADVYGAVFQARLRLWMLALGESVEQLLWAGLIVVLVIAHAQFLTVFSALVLASLGRLVTYWLMGRRWVIAAFQVDTTLWREWFREGWSLAVLAFFSILLLRIDQLMLFRLKGAAELGLYAASVRVSEPWVSVAGILTSAVYPLLCRQYGERDPEFARTYRLCYKYLLVFVVPVAVGTAVLAKNLIVLLYGPPYQAASPAFAILMVTQVLLSMEMFTVYLLIALGLQRVASAATVLAALANIGLNVVWIPRFGATGAAAAYFSAYVCYFAAVWLWPGTRMYLSEMGKRMMIPLAASGTMGGMMLVLHADLLWMAFVGVAIYAMMLAVLGGFSWQEVKGLSRLSMRREAASMYAP